MNNTHPIIAASTAVAGMIALAAIIGLAGALPPQPVVDDCIGNEWHYCVIR